MTQTTDSDTMRDAVWTRYAAAATALARATTSSDCCTAGASCCCSETQTSSISSAPYSINEVGVLPPAAVLASLGCGNPTALAELKAGEIVLALGSGGGIDVFFSARRVGPTGFAYGLDVTDEMIALVNRHAHERDVAKARFLKAR